MDRIVWKMRFLRMIPNNKKMDRKNHPVESSNKNPESLGISCHVILCPILLKDEEDKINYCSK